jgi:hypothetical protein
MENAHAPGVFHSIYAYLIAELVEAVPCIARPQIYFVPPDLLQNLFYIEIMGFPAKKHQS